MSENPISSARITTMLGRGRFGVSAACRVGTQSASAKMGRNDFIGGEISLRNNSLAGEPPACSWGPREKRRRILLIRLSQNTSHPELSEATRQRRAVEGPREVTSDFDRTSTCPCCVMYGARVFRWGSSEIPRGPSTPRL